MSIYFRNAGVYTWINPETQKMHFISKEKYDTDESQQELANKWTRHPIPSHWEGAESGDVFALSYAIDDNTCYILETNFVGLELKRVNPGISMEDTLQTASWFRAKLDGWWMISYLSPFTRKTRHSVDVCLYAKVGVFGLGTSPNLYLYLWDNTKSPLNEEQIQCSKVDWNLQMDYVLK